MFKLRCGDACIARMRSAPVRSPSSRRNSATAITTTSSRPCTVTSCGPSLLARRTSSPNRALASCKGQCAGFGGRNRVRGLAGGRDDADLAILTRLADRGLPRNRFGRAENPKGARPDSLSQPKARRLGPYPSLSAHPVTSMNDPVVYEASAESSHRMAWATSSGLPPRCIGTSDLSRSTRPGSPPLACISV